jgi:hypothetical protein
MILHSLTKLRCLFASCLIVPHLQIMAVTKWTTKRGNVYQMLIISAFPALLTFADDDLLVGIDRQESVVRTQEPFSLLKKLEIRIF